MYLLRRRSCVRRLAPRAAPMRLLSRRSTSARRLAPRQTAALTQLGAKDVVGNARGAILADLPFAWSYSVSYDTDAPSVKQFPSVMFVRWQKICASPIENGGVFHTSLRQ